MWGVWQFLVGAQETAAGMEAGRKRGATVMSLLKAIVLGPFGILGLLLVVFLAILAWVVLSLFKEDYDARILEAEYIAARAYLAPQRHARRRSDSSV